MSSPRIGVLAVQGAFAEHAACLQRLGCAVRELRQKDDLGARLDALVLPGGESTAQERLLREGGMVDALRERVRAGMPVLGTCAGLILLARCVECASDGRHEARGVANGVLGTLAVTVRRNGYGRQLGSFKAQGEPTGRLRAEGDSAPLPLTFIRAPRIMEVHEGVHALVMLEGQAVAVQQGNQIGCCFHPELDEDDRLHRLLIGAC